jgi:hypothetical protein
MTEGFSYSLAMNVIVGAFLLSSFVRSDFLTPQATPIDYGENQKKIVKIFEKVSTLNILAKNYEQPEGIARWLEEIFDFGLHTFVIFNFWNDDGNDYDEWLENCRRFRNTSVKTLYYERLYRKSHDLNQEKRFHNMFDDYDMEDEEHNMDPHAHIVTSHITLHESFTDIMDRWLTYRHSGFIVFCSFDVLELYLGCLVNRAGTFLFIIDKNDKTEGKLNNIFLILKEIWKNSPNLNLFVLIYGEIYALDPFAFDEEQQSFGVLDKLSDDEIQHDLRNLNLYNLNVEIFQSAYSNFAGVFNGRLESFVGPDVNVALFLQKQLNVSSN